MMTISICAHKKFESTEAFSSASADFMEFICSPSDQPKGLGRGYFFISEKSVCGIDSLLKNNPKF
jgi:hypothetical protein